MAYENLGKCISLEASTDLSSYQYRFVKLSTTQLALCGDGQNAIGVLLNDPAAQARAGNVMVGSGVTKVVAGGNVTAGDLISSDASGRAVTAVSGDFLLGHALETSTSGAGAVVSILFQKTGSVL